MRKKGNLSYPENLISVIGIPELYCDGEYKPLNEDQIKGLNYVLDRLFELERMIIKCRYESNMSFREIAEELDKPLERIQTIHRRLIQRLRKQEWCVYFCDGYQATFDARQKLKEQQNAKVEETIRMLEAEKDIDFSSINMDDLNLPVRITNTFKWKGIYTVEDLVRWLLEDPLSPNFPKRINGLGEGSWKIIFEQLERYGIRVVPKGRLY